MDKNQTYFAKYSHSDMDGFPRKNMPRQIFMRKGNKFFIVELKENSSKFYVCENYHEMTEEEFDLLLSEYQKEVDRVHGHRIDKGHSLYTQVPERLKRDYQKILDRKRFLDDLDETFLVNNLSNADIKKISPERVTKGVTLKEQFQKYLEEKGYKLFTPSGSPSTIYSYIKSIEKIVSCEGYEGWHEVAKHIDYLCLLYGEGGAKQAEGQKSHKTVINALQRFQEFVEECEK